MLRFSCPRCNTLMQCPPNQAGHKFACPSCGQRLQAPLTTPLHQTVLAVPPQPSPATPAAPRPVEPATATPPPPTPTSVQEGAFAKFLEFFVYKSEGYRNAADLGRRLKVWWARLTAPSTFVEAEIGRNGVHYMRHDLQAGVSRPVAEGEAVNAIESGMGRNNYSTAALTLSLGWSGFGLVSGLWSILKGESAALIGLFLGAVIAALSFASFLRESRRQVFVGYAPVDDYARARLAHVEHLIGLLRRCGCVWAYSVTPMQGTRWRPSRRYNAGDDYGVSRMPVVVIRRRPPHVHTNIEVPSLLCNGLELYFFPHALLMRESGKTCWVSYHHVEISKSTLSFTDQTGRTYHDSHIVGYQWLHPNNNNSRDRRFKYNPQLPRVDCGVLRLRLGYEGDVDLLTSDPILPQRFEEQYRQLLGYV